MSRLAGSSIGELLRLVSRHRGISQWLVSITLISPDTAADGLQPALCRCRGSHAAV